MSGLSPISPDGPDFSIQSKFNSDANFSSVLFGKDSRVLEVELNEIQDIQNHKKKEIIKLALGDGILGQGTISFSGGILRVVNEVAIVDGEILYIDSLLLNMTSGQSAYLNVREEEVDYQSVLKKNGNKQSSTTVTNAIKDQRLGIETSRRKVVTFTASTSKEARSLLLGTLTGSIFENKASKIEPISDLKLDWGRITGKPSTFPPSTHTHNYADKVHSHDAEYYRKNEMDTKLSAKSDTSHTHDTRYYTKTIIDQSLSNKSDSSHVHDDRYYTEIESDNRFSPRSHTHPYSPIGHNHDERYYTESEIDTLLSGKSNTTHNHDIVYYKKQEVDSRLAGKSDTTHTHSVQTVSGSAPAVRTDIWFKVV